MIECGQVLWLKARFNNSGGVSDVKHPYLVMEIHSALNTAEIGQMDSLEGKGYKVTFKSNQRVVSKGETVISKDGFLQKDNKFYVELYDGLDRHLRTTDRMSDEQYSKLKAEYVKYQDEYHISENKIVYMSKEEIETLNA